MTDPVIAQREPYETAVEAGRKHWWCACGMSATQPFCDGSHKGSGMAPVPFTPDVTETVYLCGCKRTATKPFCDGSHKSL